MGSEMCIRDRVEAPLRIDLGRIELKLALDYYSVENYIDAGGRVDSQ